ncbi:glycine zipper domain-containing protein [Blastopirellula sp. JC732]|uniref:Glycine zipper domain-containing protein n=1 Tax=Blastopirellula sediminis TaxID=2894196 RepID=A0A9X1MHI7_9BACT|nr:glycine zipper domain-containing protein [Blastopirellula sediminis]MCC9608153.1 glycine zipper domain-containing protein [Blastopirellula sediminis]MCC9627054.1 glycine zipper domain-containing protein [Blastopirellula sediminis]
MTKHGLYLAIAALVVAAVGCRSPYAQDRLAAAGGLTGAVAGAAIGSATGNAGAGALIGAGVGAVAGSATGAAIDESEARNQAIIQERLGRQLAGATTFQDVVAMSQAGLGDQVIIAHINKHGVATPPTPQDLIGLKNSGVSDAVLATLQNPPPIIQPVRYVDRRPVVVEEVVYDPWCYGPPYRYRHHHHHHPPGVSWSIGVHH